MAGEAILEVAAQEATGNDMKHYFEAFIDDLRSTHGKNLESVVLYGSAAAGDFIPKKSDYNILIALKTIGPEDLRNAHACVREWARLGNQIPVYFTVSELQNAADVFPIEFHQMSGSHKVLYGKDVLEGLKISDQFLRHQLEYELRSKLIQLRRKYIPASASVDGLKRLMSESLPSLASLFGAMLLFRGVAPPAGKHEIVALTARQVGIEGNVFEKIFDIRENNFTEELDEVGANRLFGEYLEQIEKVIDAIDAVGK